MLVAVIVAVICAIAVPRYANALARYQLDAAANRVIVDLDHARTHAEANSKTVTVYFSTVGNSLAVPVLPSLTQPEQAHITQLDEEPYRVRLAAADFGGDARLVFDGYGKPATGGTIILRAGNGTRTIAVDAVTGKASVQ